VGQGLGVEVPSPHALPHRGLQSATLALWTAGVPLLAAGFALDRPGWLAAAGWVLLAAVLLDGVNGVRVVALSVLLAPANRQE
jgi:hypothetical protein